jgi:hypothetical protein
VKNFLQQLLNNLSPSWTKENINSKNFACSEFLITLRLVVYCCFTLKDDKPQHGKGKDGKKRIKDIVWDSSDGVVAAIKRFISSAFLAVRATKKTLQNRIPFKLERNLVSVRAAKS